MYWNRLSDRLREQYGCKVYKLALSSGCSCPNRENGRNGCIFCDGAGSFAAHGTVAEQLNSARALLAPKLRQPVKYISYFQSFTNTYAPVSELAPLFCAALVPDDVVALSVATRPDCLGEDVLHLLGRLAGEKDVWVELGLQTVHEKTAQYIRRGYPLSVYDEAVKKLKHLGITVVVHQILGLPGETAEQMAETSRYIGHSGADGVKLHMLHVLDGTDLAEEWRQGRVPVFEPEEYIRVLETCVESLPRETVIHRLTGDGAKKNLLAPLWSADKKRVLNAIHRAFLRDNVEQGRLFF